VVKPIGNGKQNAPANFSAERLLDSICSPKCPSPTGVAQDNINVTGEFQADPGVKMRHRISFGSANLIGSPQDDVNVRSNVKGESKTTSKVKASRPTRRGPTHHQ
jgi:hypothetical protein